jgi:hypothetical protein
VKSVATSVAGAGGPRRIAEWEEEVMLAHGRIDFDAHMSRFTEKRFSRLYRLPKSDFLAVVDEISPSISRTHSRPADSAESLDLQVILVVTMPHLSGGQALDLGWQFGIVDSTTYRVIDETLETLNRHLKNIPFLETEADCQRETVAFTCLTESPWTSAALGSNVARTRECITIARASLPFVSQACVSASCKISFVSAMHAGSTHDSTTFMSTPLYTHLSKSEQDGGLPAWCHVAADNASGNGAAGSRIVTTYSGNLTPVDSVG